MGSGQVGKRLVENWKTNEVSIVCELQTTQYEGEKDGESITDDIVQIEEGGQGEKKDKILEKKEVDEEMLEAMVQIVQKV